MRATSDAAWCFRTAMTRGGGAMRGTFAAAVSLGTLAMISTPNCALAADDGADPAAGSKVEEIMVTARRSEERQEDVPVAIAVLSADALAEQRIVTEADLQAATPGLVVRQTAQSNDLNFAIRGQSIDAFSYSAPAVTAYFNEVQTRGATASGFFDMESIQVLKGPQGTLFGRNATGGAVLYSSARPVQRFESQLMVGYGDYDNIEVEGALNIPLGDAVAVRFAGRSQDRDGYQTNLVNGDKLASVDSKTGRVSLRIAPAASGFENLLVVQYGEYGGKNGSTRITNANGLNGAPATYFDPISGTVRPLTTNMRDVYGPGGPGAGVAASLGFTDLEDFLERQASVDFYDVYTDRPSDHDAEQRFASNATTFEITEQLQVKNIAGYNKVESRDPTDIDGSPYQFLTIGGGPGPDDQGYLSEIEQWSDELQLSGTALGGKLRYIAGVFVSEEESHSRIPLCVMCDLGAPGFIGRYDFTIKDESRAVFAQATYALTDKLNATVGGRFTWEDISITQGRDSLLFGVNGERSDSEPSWSLGLDYRLTDAWMIYINQRGSWRTGGFNGTSGNAAPLADTFEPETTYDVEVGAKFAGDLAGRSARFNLAIYDQIVEDAQRAPYVGISAVAGNVEEAEVRGVEVDASIDLTAWLELGGAYSYMDAEFTKERAMVAGGLFSFGPYGDAPSNQGSAYFRVAHQLTGLGEVALRGSMYSQSSFFYSNLANTISPGTRIEGYTLFNARLEWIDIMGGQLSAAAYVQNLTDEEYGVGGFPLSAVTGGNAILPGTPRMYGVEMRMKF